MIEIKGLKKVFPTATGDYTALSDIDLTIRDGEIFGIIGLSGAGKSTLVRCINLLERPTEGAVLVDGVDLMSVKRRRLLEMRRSIGMIFQSYNLLEQRTVLKNVLYPLEIVRKDNRRMMREADDIRKDVSQVKGENAEKTGKGSRAMELAYARYLLRLVGLADRENAYPSQLSGGQKQRVAIARALATEPRYLLCDEATSALDPNTTASILDLLQKINREMGVTVIVITHEMAVIEKICHRVAVIDKSRIVELGDVSQVFSNPQSDIARELILPRSRAVKAVSGGKRLRLTFNGEASAEPVVANLVMDCQAPANIMFADTKDIGGCAYGQILIELPDDPRLFTRVTAWLDVHHPSYTVEA